MMRHFFLLGIVCLSVTHVTAQTLDSVVTAQTLDSIRTIALKDVVVQVQKNIFRPQSSHFSNVMLNVPNAGQNMPYLLSSSPALVATSDDGLGVGYTYFRLRGTDHTRINMTINEVPLNDAESQTVFWVNITDLASSLTDLNVQRGVGTSVNGSSSFGGSVNMQTLPNGLSVNGDDLPVRAEICWNGGSYGTFREMAQAQVLFPGKSGLWYVGGRFSKVNSDGYMERATSDLLSYHAQVGWQSVPLMGEYRRTQVDLHLLGGKERTYMAWYGVSREQLSRNRRFNPAGLYFRPNGDTAYYDNQTDNYRQLHTQLHVRHRFNARWSLHAALHYTPGGGYYEQLMEPRVQQDGLTSHFYGGLVQSRWVAEAVDVEIGGAIHRFECRHWGIGLPFDNASGKADYDSKDTLYVGFGDKKDANIYGKMLWRIFRRGQEQWSLYADVQYRWVDYRMWGQNENSFQEMDLHPVFHFFNPKAGMDYTLRGHHVYGSFAIANREPARNNYTQSGSQSPLPERLYDYEVGYEYRGQGVLPWMIGVNGYGMVYDNQLVLTGQYSDVGAYLTRNVKHSFRAGVEVQWQVDWTRWLCWRGNVAWSKNRILDYVDYVDVYSESGEWLRQQEQRYGDVDICFSPEWVVNQNVDFHVAGFSAVWTTQVVSAQWLDNTMNPDARLRCYCVNHLHLGYRIPLPEHKGVPEWTIVCRLNNLFNTLYENNGGSYNYCITTAEPSVRSVCSPWFYPQAGFTLNAGFSLKW